MANLRSRPGLLDRREDRLDAGDRLVQAGLADPAGRDKRNDRPDRMLDDGLVVDLLVGEEEEVDAGLDREGDRLVGTVGLGDGRGLEVVADDDPRPAEVAAEEPA